MRNKKSPKNGRNKKDTQEPLSAKKNEVILPMAVYHKLKYKQNY